MTAQTPTANDDALGYLTRPDGERLAFKQVSGEGPTVVWIGGFRSDMEGTKALALDGAGVRAAGPTCATTISPTASRAATGRRRPSAAGARTPSP